MTRATASAGETRDPAKGTGGLLSTAEAAKLRRVSEKTVRKWCRAGAIPYREINGRYYLTRADVEAGPDLEALAAYDQGEGPRGDGRAAPPRFEAPLAVEETDWLSEDWLTGGPVVAEVHRIKPQADRHGTPVAGYLGTVPVAGSRAETLDTIRAAWGGGTFSVRLTQDGRLIRPPLTLDVAGDPRMAQPPREERREESRDRGDAVLTKLTALEKRFEEVDRPRPIETVKAIVETAGPIVKELVGALVQRRDPGMTLNPMDWLKGLREARDLFAPIAPADPAQIAELRRAYREGREDGREVAREPAAADQPAWWVPFAGAAAKILESIGTNPQLQVLGAQLAMRWAAAAQAAQASAAVPGATPPTPPRPPSAPADPAKPPAGTAPGADATPSPTRPQPEPTSEPPPGDVGIVVAKLMEIGRASEAEATEKCRALSAFLWARAENVPPLKALLESLIDLDADLAAAQLGTIHPAFLDSKLRPGVARLLLFERAEAEREAAAEEHAKAH